MGERKVLNRYVPPDFDPSIIPRFKREKGKQVEVRMMLPFSLRCNTCGEYMYRGKKFNSKSEFVEGDDYLGIRKLRFYIKCTNCHAEITFKTDPKNADYECESGALRNFELWRDTQNAIDAEEKEREEEEVDPMKNLEHRTMDNKLEMDILDALDEMKAINQRHQKVKTENVLDSIARRHNGTSETQDISVSTEEEKMIKELFAKKSTAQNDSTATDTVTTTSAETPSIVKHIQKQITTQSKSSQPIQIAVISRKRKADTNPEPAPKKTAAAVADSSEKLVSDKVEEAAEPVAALGLLMGYDDDDDNE